MKIDEPQIKIQAQQYTVPFTLAITMKSEAILRLAKICVPQLIDDFRNSTSSDHLTSSDLKTENVQRLWAGMGHIYRVSYGGNSFIIKHIVPPSATKQDFGDRRKALSYIVEASFYEKLAKKLIDEHHLCIPTPLYVEQSQSKDDRHEIVICMEHIKSSKANFNEKEYIRAVLKWLATLHASYWGDERVDTIVEESGLQQQGSYWYLDTRPDEHGSMPNHGWEGRLKRAARAIDNRLKRDSMQCLIHGDAKDANVMVTDDGDVVMCDFQYCGKGPPSKDLAYFFCSSVNAKDEGAALQFYLDELTKRLPPGAQAPTIAELIDSLELAYADFTRFMSGWGYWGGNMEGRVKRLLDRLDGGKDLGSEEAYEAAMHREFG